MKQNLPWNVTGVPPEARDAARSAAGREGLSVGDWLTRRIFTESQQLRSSREPVTEPDMSYRYQQDEETRRDREALAQRIAQTETLSNSAFRGFDETLRAMTRRLESTERSQNDANRTLSAAAAEINAAAREQAQAFDALNDRINRVERNSDSTPLRDAVRGLHQGLSRLADQIGRTATESSTQVTALANNVDLLATKIVGTREEHLRAIDIMDQRMLDMESRLTGTHQLPESVAQLETRIGKSEIELKDTLARHLEVIERNLEALAVRIERGEQKQSESASTVENTLLSLAGRIELGEHKQSESTSAVENTLLSLAERIELDERKQSEGASAVENTLRSLVERIEASELRAQAALEELRASLSATTRRIDAVEMVTPLSTANMTALEPLGRLSPLEEPISPLAEPTSSPLTEPTSFFAEPAAAAPPAFDLPPFPDAPPFPTGLYDPPRPGENFQPTSGPEMNPMFAAAPEPLAPAHDYLSAARRAAQAHSETAQRGRNRKGWGLDAALSPSTPTKRATSPVLLILVGLVIAASAAAWVLHGHQAAVPATPVAAPLKAAPPSTAPAIPQATTIDQLPSTRPLVAPPNIYSAPVHVQPAQPASPAAAPSAPAPKPQAHVAPAQPPAAPAAVNTAPSPLDSLLSKSKTGDTGAELLLGLKYLDGDGVAASDSEAVRWLTKAAEQGQPVAQYRLGTLYERGKGIAADPKQARYWYLQSAQRGNRKAMHNLAVSYAEGTGVDKNDAEAARWFKQAAGMGLVDSQFNLAVLYERGMGVPMSLSDAYRWYLIAAAQGDTESKSRIDALATQLAPADRDNAEKEAKAFRPQPMDNAANNTPNLADIAP